MNLKLIAENLANAMKDRMFDGLRVMIIGAETTAVERVMVETQSTLRKSGILCWALTDLLPGADRSLYLDYGCDEADLVIVLVSAEIEVKGQHHLFINKAYAAREEMGEGTIFIIPFILEDCDVPRKLQMLSPVDARSAKSVATFIPVLENKCKEKQKPQKLRVDWE